jgi:hypothetical protein
MSENQKSTGQLVLASTQLAERLGVEKSMMIETIKQQCFRNVRPDQVTDAQLASYISIAAGLQLNPLIPGMMYAYPERNGGITPIVGPDGVMKKLSELPGVTYECAVFPEDVLQRPTHATCNIYVEGKERPYAYTAVFSEWEVGNNPNWKARPRHMIWLRAIKQCARQVIHGLPMDEDEARSAGIINVTPENETPTTPAPERAAPPARATKGAAAAKENASRTKEAEAAPVAEPVKVEPVAETPKPAPAPAPKRETAPVVDAEFTDADDADDEPPMPPPPVREITDADPHTFRGVKIVKVNKGTISKIENSIAAEVMGPLELKLWHLGGDCPAWAVGNVVDLTVKGRLLKRKEGETTDTYAPMVEAITLSK